MYGSSQCSRPVKHCCHRDWHASHSNPSQVLQQLQTEIVASAFSPLRSESLRNSRRAPCEVHPSGQCAARCAGCSIAGCVYRALTRDSSARYAGISSCSQRRSKRGVGATGGLRLSEPCLSPIPGSPSIRQGSQAQTTFSTPERPAAKTSAFDSVPPSGPNQYHPALHLSPKESSKGVLARHESSEFACTLGTRSWQRGTVRVLSQLRRRSRCRWSECGCCFE